MKINMTRKHSFVLITTAVVLLVFSVLQVMQLFNRQSLPSSQIVPTESNADARSSSSPSIREPETLSDGQIRILEDYLKVNLSLLSPKREVLGGKFYLTNLKLLDANNAIISYEDGHISFDARIKFFFTNNNPSLTEFTIIAENGQLYIESPTSTPATSTRDQ